MDRAIYILPIYSIASIDPVKECFSMRNHSLLSLWRKDLDDKVRYSEHKLDIFIVKNKEQTQFLQNILNR